MKRYLLMSLVALNLMGAATAEATTVSWYSTRGLVRTRAADTVGKGMLNFSLSANYYTYPDSLLHPGRFAGFTDPANTNTAIVDYHFLTTRASLTYGLNEYFEIGATLDIRTWARNPKEKNGHDLDFFTRGGLGDTEVAAKIGIPLPTSNVKLAGAGQIRFPTGSEERGFTTGKTDFSLHGLLTLDFTDLDAFVPTRMHVNAGYEWNKNEAEGYGRFQSDYPDSFGYQLPVYPASPKGDDAFNDAFAFTGAIEFPAPQVTFFVEFDWKKFINVEPEPADSSVNVLTLTPGLSVAAASGFELLAAADINLNRGDRPAFTSPADWGLWLSLQKNGSVVPQDRDGDGVPDKDDACPDEPEDLDGFEDEDGCSDLDNDSDGVPDKDDKCPDLAEDPDGFEDNDGCPDLDNDQDGIPDSQDRCPNEPEDFDGEEDEDGCPDLVQDSDNDGIADDFDRCPLQAEDLDGFQDEDGCPDLDNDLDGIPDETDQCPNAPETFNGYLDEDGCPDERPLEQQFVLKGVMFESGSAALTPDSYRVLDDVVRSLMAYPEVRVEIQGYTDSVGKASLNQSLSRKRADSVKQYLVNAGIDPSRMVSKGYGEESPIADNTSPAGRAQNRRIEFRRLN